MKKILSIIFLLTIVCCKKADKTFFAECKKSKLDSIETIIGKVSVKDTVCQKEIDFAKEKINKDSLIYQLYMTTMSYGRQIDELKKLLKPYGINCEIFLTSCLGHGNGRRYCYADYMNETIKSKFKKGFIDSLEVKADRIYLTKNINKVYHGMDDYDKNIFYPKGKTYESQRDDCQNDFIKGYKFPIGFDYKFENKNSFFWGADFEFILYHNGDVKVSSIDIEFGNKKNNKYKTEVEKEIIKFIEKTKWIPRAQHGIKVNGKLPMYIVLNTENCKKRLSANNSL